jgi:hypothetical protein
MSGTERWGDFDFYFPGPGGKVSAKYVVSVQAGGAGPAQTTKVAEARVWKHTGMVSASTPPDATLPLKKTGAGELLLDIASYQAAEDSPLLVQFYFEMEFKDGPKKGTTEVNDAQSIGVVLAEPEVEVIGMKVDGKGLVPVGDAKVGDSVTFEVGCWGAQAFDIPGVPSFFPSALKKRLPSGYDADVSWTQDDADTRQPGPTHTFTVEEKSLGKVISVLAARTQFQRSDGQVALAQVAIPKVEILSKGGKPATKTVANGDKDGETFEAKVTPEGFVEGELAWTVSGGKLSIGDGSSSSEKVIGEQCVANALGVSAATDDQTLTLTLTSKVTGKTYTATHKLTASAWPATVEGAVLYERTWKYQDSSTPIAAVKELMPGNKVDLLGIKKGKTALEKLGMGKLGEDGKFSFAAVPECTKLTLRIHLDHSDDKTVKIKGLSNAHADADLSVKKDQVAWGSVDLDVAKIKAGTALGEVKLTKAAFVELCDVYKSVWFGNRQMKTLAGAASVPGLCEVFVPEPATSTSYMVPAGLHILASDYKDRCVILHEYGHFIDKKVGPNIPHPGYKFDDDLAETHGRDTSEHYEAAWQEAFATFMACALLDDPWYHDGYEAGGSMTYKLEADNTTIGGHSEGSIQEALWRLWKTHAAPFSDLWKAFTYAARKAHSPYAFYLNWKDLGLAKLDKLVEAYKKFGMEFHYTYDAEWTKKAATDKTKNEFGTLEDLHTELGGAGTVAEYKDEFYNRATYVDSIALGAGATMADPKPVNGTKYKAPKRVQVS